MHVKKETKNFHHCLIIYYLIIFHLIMKRVFQFKTQEKLPTRCKKINKYIKKLSGASKYIVLMS